MRRLWGKAVSVFLLYFCYVVIGMSAPFFFTKPVAESAPPRMKGGKALAYIAESNAEALEMRLALIDQAKTRIVFSVFDIRKGKSTEDVFSHLLAAADRGVQVEILVDGMYGALHMDGVPLFEACGAHDNITVRYYNTPNPLKPWSINGRMHDKYIVVDDRYVLLGGRNQFDYFLGAYKKNHGLDREVLLVCAEKNPENTVCQVVEYYEKIKKEPFVKEKLTDHPSEKTLEKLRAHYRKCKTAKLIEPSEMMPVSGTALIHNGTGRYGKKPQVFSAVLSCMEKERQETVIETPYIVCSRGMRKALTKASKGGSEITLLVNSIASGDNVCASADYLLRRGSILKTGMTVYEYMGDFSMHGKSVAVGKDIAIVGSYNFDCRSTYVDTETMLVLESEEVNRKLRANIDVCMKNALKVKKDGSYREKEGIRPPEMTPLKKATIAVLSGLFQGFRYLI